MVDFEQLKSRSLRAYELGRLRVALRIAVVLAPLSAVCWAFSSDRETCACLAMLLVGAAVWLRWRDRRGANDVKIGLLAGLLPLTVGLLLSLFQPACGGPLCLTVSAIAGVTAGAWIAKQERLAATGAASWLTAAAIAALAASLGCLPLGVLGLGGCIVGIMVGSGLGALTTR